ncbi:hypothetical protein E2562_021442 [Oryza meyeriana var. granulata]|uniref:Uncharacterized protein n=1 Tax=Oryza meyeriana var. granulata TaxID=110450 RepID=A0A6G1C8G7_9ORYZ|nr:hypothetical protein E2562_021442 [Oryza meyeriana var. granulata]
MGQGQLGGPKAVATSREKGRCHRRITSDEETMTAVTGRRQLGHNIVGNGFGVAAVVGKQRGSSDEMQRRLGHRQGQRGVMPYI